MNNRDYYFIKPYDENLPKPPAESFGQILNETFLHPFNWKARTTRKSYWLSALVNAILILLATMIMSYVFSSNIDLGLKWIDGVISVVIFVYVFLANLGQLIRRLHDTGYSGYWYWANFTGYGAMFTFHLTLQPSVQRSVKWGAYLYHKGEAYPAIEEEKVPVPTIGQILKEHFFDCFKWNARSTRTSFWLGTAVSCLISTITLLLAYLIMFLIFIPYYIKGENANVNIPTEALVLLLVLALFSIAIAVWSFLAELGHTVRRLHDAGFIGWWWWICAIPYVGNLLLAFLLFHPTTQKDIKWNKYLFEKEEKIN